MPFTIHIGLPKSGSTLLQQIFKEQTNSNTYLSKDSNNIVYQNLIRYCQDDTLYDDKNFKEIDLNFDKNTNYIISDEEFLNKTINDIGVCLKKLDILFNPRIIIVLRNQVDLIYSAYRNNNFAFYGTKIKLKGSLEDIIEKCLINDTATYHFFRFLKFNTFLESLYKIFSKDRIKILFYEDLIRNPKNFFSDINSFLNENYDYEKLKNRKTNKTRLLHKILYPKKKRICKKIFNFYYNENIELSKKFDVPKEYIDFIY